MANAWTTNAEYAELNRFKAYEKKHPNEYYSCFQNLEKLIAVFNASCNTAQVKFGFFRSEGGGIWRIEQSGLPHAAETRLYVYLYVRGKVVYQLTVGDKKQQPDDLRRCAEIVKKINKETQT